MCQKSEFSNEPLTYVPCLLYFTEALQLSKAFIVLNEPNVPIEYKVITMLRIQNCLYLFLKISQNLMRRYMILKLRDYEGLVYCDYFLTFSDQWKNT